MKTKMEEFEVLIPTADGCGDVARVKVEVPLGWDEELQEWILTPEAHEKIENTKARHLGLLLPVQLKALRKRLGLTQKKLCELLQIGEKTWTRWETGRERPSRSINVLLCALDDGRIDAAYLRELAERREGRAPWPMAIRWHYSEPWIGALRRVLGSAVELDFAYHWAGSQPPQVIGLSSVPEPISENSRLLVAHRARRTQLSGRRTTRWRLPSAPSEQERQATEEACGTVPPRSGSCRSAFSADIPLSS